MKEGYAHKDIVIAIIGVVGGFAAIAAAKMLDLNGFVTAAIVISAVLVMIISIARFGAKK